MNPIRVGDTLRDADEPEPPVPKPAPGPSLCENCFHAMVCAVPVAIATLGGGINVGWCQYQLPIQDPLGDVEEAK